MDPHQLLSDWIDLYSDRLLRIAYTYVKDRSLAEDRVQDAFIKAYRAMNQISNLENPFPWLVRIVINECKTSIKRNRREFITSLLPENSMNTTEDLFFHHLEDQNLHQAVLSLPEMYRTPIVLFHFEELSIQEIAEVLHMNQSTVKARLARGRQRLRKTLSEGDENYGQNIPECT